MDDALSQAGMQPQHMDELMVGLASSGLGPLYPDSSSLTYSQPLPHQYHEHQNALQHQQFLANNANQQQQQQQWYQDPPMSMIGSVGDSGGGASGAGGGPMAFPSTPSAPTSTYMHSSSNNYNNYNTYRNNAIGGAGAAGNDVFNYQSPHMATPRQPPPPLGRTQHHHLQHQHQHQHQQQQNHRAIGSGASTPDSALDKKHVVATSAPELESKRAAAIASVQKHRGSRPPTSTGAVAEEERNTTTTSSSNAKVQGQNPRASTIQAAKVGVSETIHYPQQGGVTVQGSTLGNETTKNPTTSTITSSTSARRTSDEGSTGSNTSSTVLSLNKQGQSAEHSVSKRSQPRATAADIDGLLAESKKAAAQTEDKSKKQKAMASPVSKRNAANNSGEHSPTSQRLQAAGTDKKKQHQQQQSQNEDTTQTNANDEEQQQTQTTRPSLARDKPSSENIHQDHHQAEQRRARHTTSDLPDRPLYEPPGRTAALNDDTSPSGHTHFRNLKLVNRNFGSKARPAAHSAKSHSRSQSQSQLQADPESKLEPELDFHPHGKEPNHSSTTASTAAPNKTVNTDGNEFAHLQPEQLAELREWLEMTGYHDEVYRHEILHNHRRKARLARQAELEKELAELKKEEQNERGLLVGASSGSGPGSSCTPIDPARRQLQLSYSATSPAPEKAAQPHSSPPASASSATGRGPQVSAANTVPLHKSRTDDRDGRGTYRSNEGQNDDRVHEAAPENSRRLKRDHPSSSVAPSDDDYGRLKLARVDRKERIEDESREREEYPTRGWGRGGATGDWSRGGRDGRGRSYNRVEFSRERGTYHESRNEENDDYTDYRHRGGGYSLRGRGRGGRFIGQTPRGSTRDGGAASSPAVPRHAPGSGSVKLQHDNTRFFLIKCISYEFVEDSQQDGVWSTQLKNIEKLVSAFNTSENVILLFSVNASKAFQGYARMESLPNESEPLPSWLDRLHWEVSAPFRLNWINTAVTQFYGLAHLTNSYNEDSLVFHGRDGQEVEPLNGLELCKLLDDNSLKRY